MRKLKPAEVTALVAALTIGSGNLDAAEPTVQATVTVTASRIVINVVPRYIFSPGQLSYSPTPMTAGNNSSTLQAQYRHAIECAAVYGRTRGGVPKDGFLTYFNMNYGWGLDHHAFASHDGTNPPVPGAFRIDGVTDIGGAGYPFILGRTQIFLSGMDTGTIINTVAHEWAHQWGLGHPAADAVGNNVEAAWLADAGAQCGGL